MGSAGRRSLESESISERESTWIAVQPVFVKERVRAAAVQLIEWGARPLYR